MSNRIRLIGLLCAVATVVGAYFMFNGIGYGIAAVGGRYRLMLSDPTTVAWLIGATGAFLTLVEVAIVAIYIARGRRALREGTPLTAKEFEQRFGASRFVPLMMMPGYLQVPLIVRGAGLRSTLVMAGIIWGTTMTTYLYAVFFQQRLRQRLARLMQCAPKARYTSGGRIHPESCR